MPNDVNIKGKISIDTGDSGQQMSNVKKGLNDVSNATKDSHSNFSNLKESLSKLSPGFKDASEGVEGLGKSFKALLLNPVVLAIAAIVTALVGLYKAFTSTMEGAEKMEQIFAGLKATLTVITDRLVNLGNAVIKVFSGDFKGAAEDARKSVDGLSKALGDAYTKTVEITRQLQGIRKEELQDAQDQAKRKARLAQLKEMVNDEDISLKERKRMAAELKTDQEKDAALDLARTKKRVELEIQQIHLKTNLTMEDLEKESKLKIELDAAQRDSSMEGVRINKIVRNLEKQDTAAAKQDLEDKKKKQEELNKAIEEELKLNQKIWWSRQNNQITVKTARADEKKAADDEAKKKKDSFDKQVNDQKEFVATQIGSANSLLEKGAELNAQSADSAKEEIERQAQKVSAYQNVGNALGALGQLIGEQTAMGKGLGIAQAMINTWVGVTEILKTKSLLPEPLATISRVANITAVVASGLNAVKNIGRVQVPGASGGGGSASMSVSSPIAPLQSSTAINASSIQGIGSAAAGGVGRTFLLDADIKDSQERSARINRAARLG